MVDSWAIIIERLRGASPEGNENKTKTHAKYNV